MISSSLQGTTLGKYEVLQLLGRGGMAQVYKGYHRQLDRYVAIKVLRSDLVEEAGFLNRFQREARSVAALHHPNIVQIFDFDIQDNVYFMVMELLEGNSLKSFHSAYRNNLQLIPFNISVKILLDVLSGLSFAHDAGIIHRDLKPANILLNNQGQAILTDFGIAQIVGGVHFTVTGGLMGTLSYMAPEQGLTNQCDFRSDLYSIGVIAYELLTGQVPFEADTPVAVLLKHINENLIPPGEINSQIPIELESIILKALAKKPEERFQNAEDFSKNLILAAKHCELDIPETKKFSHQLKEQKLKNSKVAVYSGNSREAIPDISFYIDDTDHSIPSNFRRPDTKNKYYSFLERIFKIPKSIDNHDLQKYSTRQMTLLATLVLAVSNITWLWVGGIYGWNIFIYSWPMELAAVSLLLSFLMASKGTPWFLIPIGILLGNSLLFSSSTIVGRWSIWTYTWPAETFLIAASIIIPITLGKLGFAGRWISQKLGVILGLVSGITIVAILIGSILKVIF